MSVDLLDVGQASKALNVNERWVRRAIFEGRIEVVKLGRLVRIPTSEVERLKAEGRRPRRVAL